MTIIEKNGWKERGEKRSTFTLQQSALLFSKVFKSVLGPNEERVPQTDGSLLNSIGKSLHFYLFDLRIVVQSN